MFQVRRDDLKKVVEYRPDQFENGTRGAREEAENTATMYSQEDSEHIYAVMTKITIVDKFPELRVIAIFEGGEMTWSTNKYDAELVGVS